MVAEVEAEKKDFEQAEVSLHIYVGYGGMSDLRRICRFSGRKCIGNLFGVFMTGFLRRPT